MSVHDATGKIKTIGRSFHSYYSWLILLNTGFSLTYPNVDVDNMFMIIITWMGLPEYFTNIVIFYLTNDLRSGPTVNVTYVSSVIEKHEDIFGMIRIPSNFSADSSKHVLHNLPGWIPCDLQRRNPQ